MATHDCSSCGRAIGLDAIYCPHCLDVRIDPDPAWFPVTTEGSDNQLLQHRLVPKHRLLPEERTRQLLREYDVDRNNLPQIKETDPAIEHLTCEPGDVVEIVRDSRTTDTSKSYRLVVGDGSRRRSGSTSSEEWRNPTAPSEELYTASDELTESTALHVLDNLRAHVPPSQPGACEAIAVDRREEIETATSRIDDGEPFTFVQGELGFGKSFFLYWVRDRVFPTTAVSFVDLGESVTFTDESAVVDTFRQNLETPRSAVSDEYANGLDELWDTFQRQVANLCANYYEGEGYELRTDRVGESLTRAVESILRSSGIEPELAEQLGGVTEGYFDSSAQSLSKALGSDVDADGPEDVVALIAALARINGYRVLFGVDELEKSERTEEHFEAIDAFVDRLPQNVSLFVTGTPELVTGGEEGNAMRETYEPLYERAVDSRIELAAPPEDDLVAFAERLEQIEALAIDREGDREYSAAIAALGGPASAVESFLSEHQPSFRSLLGYLESVDADE